MPFALTMLASLARFRVLLLQVGHLNPPFLLVDAMSEFLKTWKLKLFPIVHE
jgi:hypothetical protein